MNLVGTSVWGTCEDQGTNPGSSTRHQVALMKDVGTRRSSCTLSFEQPQGFVVCHPQSTAPITTIKELHHLTASVIASIYTEPLRPKDAS